MKKLMLGAVYLSGFLATYGQMNYASEHMLDAGDSIGRSIICQPSKHSLARIKAFAWGIFPPMWVLAPILLPTISHGHGWSLGINEYCVAQETGSTNAR